MQPASIVSTVLNEAEDIDRMVMSLLAQVPSPLEVIVVDGGSIDSTWEQLKAASASDSRLVAIRDETCNLKFTAGPISRGRNVAIRAAKSSIIACADAGCTYAPDWLGNLTASIVAGDAEYAVGGSCLDESGCTVWDVASAPFFSIRLSPTEPTKSCTARSMAFSKALWERIGGFPEHVLVCEDTLFDREARRLAKTDFVANAKAYYMPRNTFRSACQQTARYSIGDGQVGVRWGRLLRNAARCIFEVLSLACLHWSFVPLLACFALELWYAYHRDWRHLGRFGAKAILARFAFSVAVPWVVAVNQVRGCFSQKQVTNPQNKGNKDRNTESVGG